jgi:hypothetical protein
MSSRPRSARRQFPSWQRLFHFDAILLPWRCSPTRKEGGVRTNNSNRKPARAPWVARLRATKHNPVSRASDPEAPGCAGPEKSPQAQVVSLDREVDNLLAMRTSTEFEPNLQPTAVRRIRAHARPSANAKPTSPYSTINRGGAAADLPPQDPAASCGLKEKGWDTVAPNFAPIALKTNDSDAHRVGHFFKAGSRVPRQSPVSNHQSRHSKCHTMQGRFRPISLKTNVRHPREVTHNFGVLRHV